MNATLTLAFDAGTIELKGLAEGDAAGVRAARHFTWDARTASFRAPAQRYAEVILDLRREGVAHDDQARAYEELAHGLVVHRAPRPYQTEALDAWKARGFRGVVVLPTGAGKTHLAVTAIDDRRRATLVVAPTLDLVRQWYDVLRASFGVPVGVVGGGDYEVLPLTVTTYDSAYLTMDRLGARFGLIVFDECHHLPGPSYAQAARLSLAPFRLGLTATPERSDGREADLDALVGPVVYRKDIQELAGEWLADYDTERVELELSAEERAEHDAERGLYLDWVRSQRIFLGSPRGFSEFVMRSAGSVEGRRAMRAYRRQRELAFGARAKLAYVEHLLETHRGRRCLVFTEDNATAYALSRRLLVPCITHQTRVAERSQVLDGFGKGVYGAVVTSKVLNEGVDVEEADVAIVLSGSGSVREHVQRLGRILRKREGKRSVLFELVTKDTAETGTSQRRREHDAYR